MRSIALKLPEELLEESGRLAERRRISRAEYIRIAIRRMNRKTAARLRALAGRGKLGREDIGAIIQGFFVIQQLRLRQQQSGTPAGLANRVNPDTLNEFDRLILKEAFKQAKKLQGRLQMEYRL